MHKIHGYILMFFVGVALVNFWLIMPQAHHEEMQAIKEVSCSKK